MSKVDVACYVVGALVVVYIVAATWHSKERDPPDRARERERLR